MNQVALDAPDAMREYQSRLGMWVFLATELMFFGPVFFAYAIGRLHHPEAFNAASHHTDVVLGTINTIVLLTSSAAIAMAGECVRGKALSHARRLMWLTVLLGCVFLAIKGYEYAKDLREGLFPDAGFDGEGLGRQAGARLFFFVYFVATGLHAVHLTVGIFLVLYMLRQAGRISAVPLMRQVEATGLYWHFVDIVWVFLFPILYLAGRAS